MSMRPRTLASVSGLALVIGCSVGKLFDSPPIKVIGVTPPWVIDSAPAGSATTVPAKLMISTTGGGEPRTWKAHRAVNADWLWVSADTGSTPDTVELALDPHYLPPGTYRDTIVIVPDDPGAAQLRVPVRLHVMDSTTTTTPPPPPPPPPPSPPPPPPPPPPPVANFTPSCTWLTCNFDGRSSTAQPTATYGWTWDDGTPSGSGKTASHTYAQAGTYNVTLTVTDAGGTDSKTQPVTVSAPPSPPPPPPPPPVANFTPSCTWLTCNFDGSSSTAQATATYRWTWDDGTPSGSGKTASHTYGAAGTYNVTLTVTDAGGTDSKTQPVTVSAPPPPPPPPPPPATSLLFTQDPPNGLHVGGSFSVQVTAYDSQGGTATGFTGLVSLTLEGQIVLGVLSGQKSVNAVNGIATFNNLKVTGACTGCWLTATAAGLTGATSGTFSVIGP